ncbi:unnamed protein product [Dracunculus medinensis]|uniref:Uncharacterized protein n=1 Tax=Dracunculus medinensis TaxID=318479 RepID=A0A3P7P7R7_DRAME|nr:unnamed protein product [Dracunculus medinensis]
MSFLNDAHTRIWVYSIVSTLIISIAPFALLVFIPLQSNAAENEPLLKILLSFGSGGLLGDAFLHLIPHSQSNNHNHSHDDGTKGHSHGSHDLSVGGCVLAGIIAFLIVEKTVRIVRGGDGHGHSHSYEDYNSKIGKLKKSEKDKMEGEKKELDGCKSKPNFRVAAYLNLVADFVHNFTDGLAIGASYLAGTTIGFVTMITVLVHEVPHEIGDFAILVQSGFSKKKAMFVQLLTAVGAIIGCILSLSTANTYDLDTASSSWVLPFTAGGFIYIATVSVIPELLEKSSTMQSIMEIFALLFGIWSMYLIALFE